MSSFPVLLMSSASAFSLFSTSRTFWTCKEIKSFNVHFSFQGIQQIEFFVKLTFH